MPKIAAISLGRWIKLPFLHGKVIVAVIAKFDVVRICKVSRPRLMPPVIGL